MDSRSKVLSIANRKSAGHTAFWTGNPDAKTVPLYTKAAGVKTLEEVYRALNDDCRWIPADSSWKPPQGKPPFYSDDVPDFSREMHSVGSCFADCENVKDVEKFPWPDVKYLDFTGVIADIKGFAGKAVFSGFWSCFFNIAGDLFGTENYFIKMHTDPAVVEAVTERILDYLVAANDLFLKAAGGSFDIFFFGNDLGTQLDLLISPENFKKFVLPGFKRIIGVAKKYGKKVMLHSCGAIYRAIPLLIEAGVDILHPLQAKAKNMDAASLSQYKNDLAFCGGIDTQGLLVSGKPDDIRREVDRVKRLLGPNLIVSPSHEALLPNVPFENIRAMSEEARGLI